MDLQLMGEGESLLAVATNSEQLKVFDRGSQDCQVLRGCSPISDHPPLTRSFSIIGVGCTVIVTCILC